MGEIILDLGAYQEETADIRMAGGEVLHLKKPSEALVIELMGLKDLDEHGDPLKILRALDRVTAAVLNNNADGVTFAAASVSALEYGAKVRIIEAYTEFATQLQSRPTASSPSSPETSPETRRRSLRERLTRWRSTRA